MQRQKRESASGQLEAGIPLLSVAPFFVGLRYILRKKLSYLAMIGIAISVATLVVVMSVMTGFSHELKEVIRGYLSDVIIQPRAGGLYGLEDWQAVRKKVLALEQHVTHVAPFIQGYGFISRRFPAGGRIMRVITFKGVDPELEKGVSKLDRYVQQDGGLGRLNAVFEEPNEAQVRSCIIGEVLAELVMLYPGEIAPVTLITISGKGLERRLRKFNVNAVFKTGEYDYDSSWVILPLDEAERFVRSGGGVSGLNVKLRDYSRVQEAVPAIREALGGDFMVGTWEDQRKPFLEAVAMERFLQGVIMSFIMVLAGFCIFSILTTMVYEKRRDIGTLKAIGSTGGQIASVFLLAGLSVGLIGAALGVTGGMLFCANINEIEQFIENTFHFTAFPQDVYYFDRIPTDDGFLIPAIVAGGAIMCSLIFSLIPALRAARLDPVETLRFE